MKFWKKKKTFPSAKFNFADGDVSRFSKNMFFSSIVIDWDNIGSAKITQFQHSL